MGRLALVGDVVALGKVGPVRGRSACRDRYRRGSDGQVDEVALVGVCGRSSGRRRAVGRMTTHIRRPTGVHLGGRTRCHDLGSASTGSEMGRSGTDKMSVMKMSDLFLLVSSPVM